MSFTRLLDLQVQQFIHEHEQDDPAAVALQASRYPDLPIPLIAAQLQARQKAKLKCPEWHQQEGLIFPPPLSVEQASSEATARYKSRLVSGHQLADLTGGMGIDTFYLGQQFEQVDYVEQQAELAELARHNFEVLQARHIRVHASDAEGFLLSLRTEPDTIYLDPARRDLHARKVFRLQDCTPDVIALQETLLSRAPRVLLKTAPLLDIEAALQSLKNVASVYVVAVDQECKEVLYLMQRGWSAEPEIHAIHLQHGQEQVFRFFRSAESEAKVAYTEPQTYIYEPNAALMKAGAFRSLAAELGLAKLHPNSHLYTSEELKQDFPGRIFFCDKISSYNKKALKKELKSDKANISTRNFPDSVQQIRKKTGLKEGGDTYLLATTHIHGKPILLICRKVEITN
ncbi:MAG: THUMP-like domain-containing protein [Cyclobacteriaceae bacterium]